MSHLIYRCCRINFLLLLCLSLFFHIFQGNGCGTRFPLGLNVSFSEPHSSCPPKTPHNPAPECSLLHVPTACSEPSSSSFASYSFVITIIVLLMTVTAGHQLLMSPRNIPNPPGSQETFPISGLSLFLSRNPCSSSHSQELRPLKNTLAAPLHPGSPRETAEVGDRGWAGKRGSSLHTDLPHQLDAMSTFLSSSSLFLKSSVRLQIHIFGSKVMATELHSGMEREPRPPLKPRTNTDLRIGLPAFTSTHRSS